MVTNNHVPILPLPHSQVIPSCSKKFACAIRYHSSPKYTRLSNNPGASRRIPHKLRCTYLRDAASSNLASGFPRLMQLRLFGTQVATLDETTTVPPASRREHDARIQV